MMDKNERKGVNNREMSFISGVSLFGHYIIIVVNLYIPAVESCCSPAVSPATQYPACCAVRRTGW